MAILDMQEQEQLDAFKSWWKDNGKWLLLVLGLALGVFVVVQGWKTYKGNNATEAFTLYDEMGKQLASNDPKRINDAAAAIMDKFSSSAYAPRAALAAAQVNIQFNDLPTAKSQLQWTIDNADESGLQHTARLKLATVLLDEKNFDGALKLLEESPPEAYAGLYADLKGDVLSVQGKTEEARAAYQLAYDKIDPKSSYRSMIQVKLEAVGGAK